ncbi:hypothetical protein L7F22_033703 [Adiantum nelumboides]|nr:hypothetical protein [Adiantum nelumboides]
MWLLEDGGHKGLQLLPREKDHRIVLPIVNTREKEESKEGKGEKKVTSSPSSSPSSSSNESSGYSCEESQRTGHRKSYVAWKRSNKLKKFKEGGKNISFLTYDGTFGAIDKVMAFIEQFDAAFGDEGFTETCKLRHVAMHFQKSASQWLVDLPGTSLKDKEVCVRMLAAPINPSDINRIEGVYPIGPPPPAIGGNEGVGEVIAVAQGVHNLSVNDWVIPAKAGLGTWRTYVVKEETDWCKVRRDVPVEYAATAFINPCAALRMLEDFVPLSKGDLLVQNGANSMVGQCVIQLAYVRGLQTANIIRDRPGVEEVKQRLKFLGATGTFTETEAESKELLGDLRNAKLGLNCVGGSAANVVMKLLRENGTMVTYGGMSKKPITVSTSAMIFKGIELKGFWLQKWVNRHSPAYLARMTDYILGLVHENKLVYLTEKVPFTEFRKALENALGMHGSSIKQVLTFT